MSLVPQESANRHASFEVWAPCLCRLAAPGHELNTLSVGGGGTLAVAGGPGELLFWDRRTRQQLSLFEDTHAEAVTQVNLYCTVRSNLGLS